MTDAQTNLTPYAGGETQTGDADDGGRATRSSRAPRAISDRNLRAPDMTRRGTGEQPAIRQDIEGYAPKPGYVATREDDNQRGDRNTGRGVKGATIPCGEFTDESSLQVPGSVTPYANEARTSAARRDADGL